MASELGGTAPESLTESSGHPLFPRSESDSGPETRRIDLIHIERWLPDGTKEICPKAFRAAELRSWEEIVGRYGGGVYQLRAQCGRTHQFQGTSEKVVISSPPPRPFIELPRATPSPEPPPTPAAVAPAPQPFQATPMMPSPAGAMPMGAMAGAIAMGAHHGMLPPFYPPPPPPPPPSSSGELAAVLQALIRSTSEMQGLVMKAMLEAQPRAHQQPPPPNHLELLRDLLPLLSGNANGTSAVKEGIELAKGLLQQQQQVGGAQEDIGATLTAVIRAISPAAAPQPAAAPAAPSWGWPWGPPPPWYAMTPQVSPPPSGAPAPPSAAPPTPSAPAPTPLQQALQTAPLGVDGLLTQALSDPSLRARLRAALDTTEASTTPPAARTATTTTTTDPSQAPVPTPTPSIPVAVASTPPAPPATAPSSAGSGEAIDVHSILHDPGFQALLGQLAPPEILAEAFGAAVQAHVPTAAPARTC